jgi:gamma-glutamyl:cysteine ligase YbdK (ATP-grasp superfamily)
LNAEHFLSLFEAFGVELEYMIVADDSLSVLPIADELLRMMAGSYESEIELGDMAWSNELALHVIELKTNGPTADLADLPERFGRHVEHINNLLAHCHARLMPTAMHPWMDPHRELRLWPHEHNAVYEAFNRVFDCRGHGWANLQSVHLNLPFADDYQFGQLHAAIRLVLPLLPALSASSPVLEQRIGGQCDMRLHVYRSNAAMIPSVTGLVVPEAVFTRHDYEQAILQPMYCAIAPHDPQGTLQHEWLNARGAIARFDRQTIEVRLLDMQECPHADLAICAGVIGVLRALVDQQWSTLAQQQSMSVEPLADLLLRTIRDADAAMVDHQQLLAMFGISGRKQVTAGELWQELIERTRHLQPGGAETWRQPLSVILDEGPLARRIMRRLDSPLTHERLHSVYGQLCDCLSQGTMFH